MDLRPCVHGRGREGPRSRTPARRSTHSAAAEAVHLYHQLAAAHADAYQHHHLAWALTAHAIALRDAGRFNEAVIAAGPAVALYQQLLQDGHHESYERNLAIVEDIILRPSG